MSPRLSASASLLGRILLSVIFLVEGPTKVIDWSHTAEGMANHGIPLVPLSLTVAVVVETLGRLAILLGFQTRVMALVVFMFLIPTTLIYHNFWAASGSQQQDYMLHFLKNLAIMGGLLEFCAFGAGALSVDARLARRSWASALWTRVRRPV
jgi:putative oxidoreductase